jgi:asparagine synthase (glutamine-hydrolysing)
MCGICGAIGFNKSKDLVHMMNQAMIHRGPDNDGILADGPIALGIRRLRIIDLKTGDQPIYNEDHTIGIVFNGEVYNFQKLYQELTGLGHHFTTRTDTEAIVHAYEEWGPNCLSHLRGMFAFAIWDRRLQIQDGKLCEGDRRIFLARDRLGIKPLYVWDNGNQLLFASEVRALLASGKIQKSLSAGGLYTYLALGSVQEPLTMIEGVTSLQPASWMEIVSKDEKLEIKQERYWSPPPYMKGHHEHEEVKAWLVDAVSSHLVSDVPLGAFLSGGLDSGSIVAIGGQSSMNSSRTFTLAFDNWPYDERQLAELTAKHCEAYHTCRVISEQDVLTDISLAISSMDQPTVDGINTWFVSREARRSGLTVALSGVGGDELFAGYPSFRQVQYLKRLQHLRRWLKILPSWHSGLRWLPGSPDSRRKLVAFLSDEMPLNHPYFAIRNLFTESQIVSFLNPAVHEQLEVDDSSIKCWRNEVRSQIKVASQYDAIGEVSWLEISQYMRSTLLRDTDMMSMAHSLEVRVPFVDHLLVERVLPICGKHKLKRGQQKPLLVEAMNGILPPEVMIGTKRTFTLPFEIWLRTGLSQEVAQCLRTLSDGLRRWIDPTSCIQVWKNFDDGNTNWARPWALYILDAWVKNNF